MTRRRGVAAAILVLIVAAACIRLGFWQLGRLDQRRAYNREASAALALPPLTLDSITLAATFAEPGNYLYRRVVARGRFVPGEELLLRGRAHEGRPGVHLVTPLLLTDGGGAILVNRGWLPSPDAAKADPRPHRIPREQAVEGWLQEMPPPEADAEPLVLDVGDTSVSTYRRLDRRGLSARTGNPLPPLYLQLSAAPASDPIPPIPVPLPAFDEGPHLSYAIQWFSFAAIAVIGFSVALRVGRREGGFDRPEGV